MDKTTRDTLTDTEYDALLAVLREQADGDSVRLGILDGIDAAVSARLVWLREAVVPSAADLLAQLLEQLRAGATWIELELMSEPSDGPYDNYHRLLNDLLDEARVNGDRDDLHLLLLLDTAVGRRLEPAREVLLPALAERIERAGPVVCG